MRCRDLAPLVLILILVLGAALSGLGGCSRTSGPAPAPGSPAYYDAVVQPILRANCYRCHAGLNHKGGLQLDSLEAIRCGGQHGAVLVPGHPESSLLVRLIRHEDTQVPPRSMPPKSKLSDRDIAAIAAWVKAMPAN
jgi:cytochrome c